MAHHKLSRRGFLGTAAGLSVGPYLALGQNNVTKPMKREMGRLNFEATTLGLGGQSSLQWTPADVDPVKIILKAFDLGLNYFDTSNAYGPSQSNYGKAFRELHLAPGESGYDERKRRSFFLTSKTVLRFGKGGWNKPGLMNFTNGPRDSHTVDDVRRTLSQVFGDGNGNYPAGAYLDMVLVHAVSTMEDVEAAYVGYGNPDPQAETIGAMAALQDLRDGTNLTGLNPKEEKLIRHIGFSGHHSPAVMIEMIQRDEHNILEGMLVAINANDRQCFNMQYNAIPVAAAKNMGMIAMKTFADGAMYTKPANWSTRPEHVVRTVGSAALPSRPLVQYSLSIPGIDTLIIGTGQIDSDPKSCQLTQNLASAQIASGALALADLRAIEKMAGAAKDGKTNYFQAAKQELTAPREASIEQEVRGGKRVVRLTWQTAYAGDEPIANYEIRRDGRKIGELPYRPQTTKAPLLFEDFAAGKEARTYRIATVDTAGRTAVTGDLTIDAVG
jgi:aryl-alcohol dehydrogenase-like predicted oxidoreductase